MKTTVDIPDELYRKACKLAAANGQQVVTLINEGLQRLVIHKLSQGRVETRTAGIVRHRDLPPRAAAWLNEWRRLGRRRQTEDSVSAGETISRMRR